MPNPPQTRGIDPPVVIDATYALNANDRRYIDSQIRNAQQNLVDSLLSGHNDTWFLLDSSSVALNPGDAFCASGLSSLTVTKATGSALTNAGSALGIAMIAAVPGAPFRGALHGQIPPSVTGLTVGGGKFARVSTAGRAEAVSSFSTGDMVLGTIDANGTLSLNPGPQANVSNLPVLGSASKGQGLVFDGTNYVPTGLARRFPITAYGAVADTKHNFGGVSVSNGNHTITVTSDATHPGFVPGDVGKVIVIRQAVNTVGGGTAGFTLSGNFQNHPKPQIDGGVINNPATLTNLVTTITLYRSATQVDVAVAPTHSISGTFAIWGTDNTAAIQAAHAAAVAAGGGVVWVPSAGPPSATYAPTNAGMYLFAGNVTFNGGSGVSFTRSVVELEGEGWYCDNTATPDDASWWQPQIVTGSVLYAAGNVGLQLGLNFGSLAKGVAFLGSGNLPNVMWDDRGPDFDFGGVGLNTVFPTPLLQIGGTGARPGGGAIFRVDRCGFFNASIGLCLAKCERGVISICQAEGCCRGFSTVNNLTIQADGIGFAGNVLVHWCTGQHNDVLLNAMGLVGSEVIGLESNRNLGPCIYIGSYLGVAGYDFGAGQAVNAANLVFSQLDLEQGGQESVEIDLSTGGYNHITFRNGGPSAQTGGVNGPVTEMIKFDHGGPSVHYLTLENVNGGPGNLTLFNCYETRLINCQDVTDTNGTFPISPGLVVSNINTDLTQYLYNADLSLNTGNATLASGNLTLTSGNETITAGHLSFGASPATVGSIRLPNGGSIGIVTTGGTSVTAVLYSNSADALFFGNPNVPNTYIENSQSGVIHIAASVAGDDRVPAPFSWAVSGTTCTLTSGTFNISGVDQSNAVHVIAPTGGSLSNDLTVQFPNTTGFYMLDVAGVNLNGHNLILANAGGASFTVTALSVNSDILFVLINPRGANTITVRA